MSENELDELRQELIRSARKIDQNIAASKTKPSGIVIPTLFFSAILIGVSALCSELSFSNSESIAILGATTLVYCIRAIKNG